MIPIRDENPTRSFPVVTVALILANALIFLYQYLYFSGTQGNDLIDDYALIPHNVSHFARTVGSPHLKPFLTIFTSMFLHAGFLHVIGNLWFLWIFGNNVEDSMGRARFIGFYLLCGLGAAVLHVAFFANSTVPTIGASGAVSGILGAYLRLFPRARVITVVPIFFFFTTVRLPAWVFLGVWLALQVIPGLAQVGAEGAAGIAFWAHVGGFAVGALLVPLLASASRRRRSIEASR